MANILSATASALDMKTTQAIASTMDLKTTLNSCKTNSSYTKITDLSEECGYRVVRYERVNTQYGESIMAVLEGFIAGAKYIRVYLPRRFNEALSDKTIESYNAGIGARSSEAELETALNAALEAGYRHIDTAYRYFNEGAIGKTLKKWFDSGKLKREELFITTKLPPNAMNEKYVEEYLKKSLSALQMSYIDLYLIHAPVGFKPIEGNIPRDFKGDVDLDMNTDLVAIWKAMEAQVDAGRARAIGVSNFNTSQIDRLLKVARIPPANLQVELYLYFQQKELQEWSKRSGVTLTAYAPLGSNNMKTFIAERGGYVDDITPLNPLEDPVVTRIARVHGKTPAQILLRHILQLSFSIIPKSTNPDRIRLNFQVFDFELSDKEMEELNSLDKGKEGRKFTMKNFKGVEAHPEYPFK